MGAGVLLLSTIGIAVLVTVKLATPPDPGRTPPFSTRGPVGVDRMGREVGLPAEGVLLYVDDQCRFCAKELKHWADAVTRLDGVSPTVVVSPKSDQSGAHVPAVLRAGMVHDVKGDIARMLELKAVPLRVVVRNGIARSVSVGVSRPEDVRALVLDPKIQPEVPDDEPSRPR